MIFAMNFVWGSIDMLIFYRMDVLAQKRHMNLILSDDGTVTHRSKIYNELGNTIFDTLSEQDKQKAVDLIRDSNIESDKEVRQDRKSMLFSAISCFIITILTVIPVVLTILLIPDEELSLNCATIVSCISLFFVAYHLHEGSKKAKILFGLFIMLFSYVLTIFATYLGG